MREKQNKTKVLVFCRGAVLRRFQEIFDPISHQYHLAFLTDSDAENAHSLKQAFYRSLRDDTQCTLLDEREIGDVIQRCRLLRNIDLEQANALVHAMGHSIELALAEHKPACIASQMVDEYVSHLVCVIARKLGIAYFGFCAGYFPSTSLLLSDENGRPLRWREAKASEVEQAYNATAPDTFRQNYSLKTSYDLGCHIRSVARYKIKALVFSVLRRVRGDFWNVHYAQTPFIAERRHLRDYASPSLFSADWHSELCELRKTDPAKPVLYLPLSYFPEATIDYWVENTKAIDYENFVLQMCMCLSRDFVVVVKEHIHMMGARSRKFLERLNDMPGVISVHPSELSNIVLSHCDAMVVGSGSPGLEATLRLKPVVSFCKTSYWFGPARATFLDIDTPEEWGSVIKEAITSTKDEAEIDPLGFVKDCLSASTKVEPSTNPWPSLDREDLSRLIDHLVETSNS